MNRPLIFLLISCLVILMDGPAVSAAESNREDKLAQEEATDPDAARRYRLLPVPIFVTEPAIGEGLGFGLALFHPVKEGKVEGPLVETPESLADIHEARPAPPVVTGVMGAYTNNDTWFAGLAHINNWRNDSIRYVGVLAAARINSKIYPANIPVNFTMESIFTLQEMKFRLGNSDFMLGGGFEWVDADNRFGLGLPNPAPGAAFTTEFNNSGFYVNAEFDSRDNSTNPARGQRISLALKRYDDAIGGDFDYWNWRLEALSFHPLGERFTLGLRLEYEEIDGAPPFSAFPYVKLRGIPAMRYQGERAGVLESELRLNLAPRWQVSAFAGAGTVGDSGSPFDDPGSIYNFGVGGRYKVLDSHDIWMGIDVARGPEEWNWYVQVGQAW